MAAILYGANVSPFVRKVRAYLAEKAIDHEFEQVNPFDPPASYREISPLGKVPAFRDGDHTLADSSVICLYLERRHPTPPMLPADDYDYARALWFEEFIDAGFVPKAGGNVFFPLVVGPMMDQPVTDEVRAAVDQSLAEEVTPMWDYLESEIAGRQFFVGDSLTLGDLAVASVHVNLYYAGVDVDASRHPGLAAFVQRMFERPSFQALIAEETGTWNRREALGVAG